jgi:hypothetical protein
MLTSGTGHPLARPDTAIPDLFSTQVATIMTSSVDLHADASPLQPVVDRLERGDQAIIIFVQGDWLKVRQADAREGWLERTHTSTHFEELAAAQIRSGNLAAQIR